MAGGLVFGLVRQGQYAEMKVRAERAELKLKVIEIQQKIQEAVDKEMKSLSDQRIQAMVQAQVDANTSIPDDSLGGKK